MTILRLTLAGLLCAASLTPAATAAPPSAPIKALKSEDASPPDGFVETTVQGVMATEQGKAVVLKYEKEGVVMPIWIGDGEALSIQLRLERRRFERPLTHDLLDAIMKDLGGQLVKIHVDDLKSGTFVGTVFVRQGKRVIRVDARPSDAIALAIGNRVPIFVSRAVLEQAGVREQASDGKQSPEPDNQEKLLKDIIESGGEEKAL